LTLYDLFYLFIIDFYHHHITSISCSRWNWPDQMHWNVSGG